MWPGYILGRIFEGPPLPAPQTNQIGTVMIENSPLRLSSPSNFVKATNSSLANSSSILGAGANSHRRWLRCYLTMLSLALPHPVAGLVTDDSRFLPKSQVARYGYPCRNSGLQDRVELIIYPVANRGSTLQLTWESFMHSLVRWLAKFAQRIDGGQSMKILADGKPVAAVSMHLQGGAAAEE